MKQSDHLLGLVVLGVWIATTDGVSAQQKGVDSFSCKDVMRSGDDDRDATIAFLHGFLLAKSGSNVIDVEAMSKQTDAFVERCLDNPAEKAVDAMSAVKK